MRAILSFPREQGLGLRFFVTLLLIFSFFIFKVSDFAGAAAGDVTLTASAFSDPDAEDTFNASQWVVRNSGSTVYDQTAGAVTSIAVPAATFVNGTTYWWKVRYQDQHLVWGDYSAESSFVYGTEEPVPSPSAESSTAVPSPSVSASASASASVSPSPSVSPSLSPSPAPTITCMFGWAFLNGEWTCLPDPQPRNAIYVPEDQSDFCSDTMVKVTYYYWHSFISGGWLSTLEDYEALHTGKPISFRGVVDAPVHNIYLSTDGGSVYKRIEHDFNPMPGSVMEVLPDPVKEAAKGRNNNYPSKNLKFLKVTHYVKIPANMVSDPQKAKLLVYVADNRHYQSPVGLPAGTIYLPSGGEDLGDSFLFNKANSYETYAGPNSSGDVMDFTNGVEAKACGNESVTPTVNQCKSTITSPKTWSPKSSNRIAWASGFESSPADTKTVNVLIDKDDRSSVPVAMLQPDTGSLEAKYDPGSDKSVNLRLEQYLSGNLVSSCSVNLKVSGSCTGTDCIPGGLASVDRILVLGSILATILSLLLSTLSRFPAAARVLSALFNQFSAPVWPAGAISGKHAWGIVYDTSAKTPLEKAIIRVFSEPSGRLRSTIRTNKNGQFGFVMPPGAYSLTCALAGYDFPSRLITTTIDGPYSNLYKGGTFQINTDGSQKAQTNFNIPLDRVKVSTFDIVELKTLTTISKFFQAIRLPFMILGTLATGYLIFTQTRTIDYVFGVIYVAMWAWEITNMLKKRAYGVIKDQQGSPLSLVVIRVLDKFSRLKTTIVTGDDGKFQANLDPGEYRFDISKPGYKSIRTQVIKVSNIQDLSRLNISLDKL